jgi:hypothetical protein
LTHTEGYGLITIILGTCAPKKKLFEEGLKTLIKSEVIGLADFFLLLTLSRPTGFYWRGGGLVGEVFEFC